MKKRGLRLVALLLSLMMLFALTACGGGGGGTPSGNGDGGAAALGDDVESLTLPLAETVTLKGLTNYPSGRENKRPY